MPEITQKQLSISHSKATYNKRTVRIITNPLRHVCNGSHQEEGKIPVGC